MLQKIGIKKLCNVCNIWRYVTVKRLKTTNSTKHNIMDHELRDVLLALVILGSIGATLVLFAKTITEYILKKKMIEKGYVNEDTQAIFKRNTEENRFASLKWGLIILSGGLSLVLMEYVDYDTKSTLPYGLFAVFVSLGFLAYYFMVKKELSR